MMTFFPIAVRLRAVTRLPAAMPRGIALTVDMDRRIQIPQILHTNLNLSEVRCLTGRLEAFISENGVRLYRSAIE